MKALPIALLALACLAILPASAQAQQAGAMTVLLSPPEEPLVDGGVLTFVGTVTITTDWTVLTSMSGVPVQYMVTEQPEWATVVVSPASDIFPVGQPYGTQYYATRTIVVTVTLAEDKAEDATGVIEVTATTTPGILGRPLVGIGQTPVVYDAPEEPCPEHAFTDEQIAALAVEAADAYNAYQAEQPRGDGSEDVTVQSAGARPVSTGWIVVGGLGLVGAGIGLLLRRRFA